MVYWGGSDEEPTAGADASATAAPATAVAATTTAAPKPKPRPMSAAAIKLAKLRKKVKRTRSRQIDPECAKYLKKLRAGYVFAGGTFQENKYVANASGCRAVAAAAKAPWFCCPR